MTESRRNILTKVLAIVLALLLVVAVSALSKKTAMKATEEGMAETAVEEQVNEELYIPEVEVTEEPYEDTEPVVETEIIDIEEIPEEKEAELPEEEETDAPVEETEILEEEEAEEAELMDLDVEIWYEFPDGNNGAGSRLVFKSVVKNAPEWMSLHYTWQYDRGAGWEDIPGGDGAEYETELTAETGTYQWRLIVTGD